MEQLGKRIGHYRIVAHLGQGGMGDVFEAEDETLQRRVALKSINAEDRPSAREKSRFLREARILSSLDHQGICRIYDYLEGDDRDHLVLELVRGVTLSKFEANRSSKLDVMEQLLEVLVLAHEADIIHRDLKPDNVMVTTEGVVKILDFGLARQLVQPDPDSDTISLDTGDVVEAVAIDPLLDQTFTRHDGVLGTPSFMSPEQAAGEMASTASDMYSCGLVMQFLLTGKPVYKKCGDLPELLARVRAAETQPMVGVDSNLEDLIDRLTSCAPGVRPTASVALAKLRWIRRKPARRNRRLFVALAVVFIVAAGFKYTLDLQSERSEADLHRAKVEDLMGFMLGDLRDKLEPVNRLEIMDVLGNKAMEYFSGRNPAELSNSDADRYVRTLSLLGEIRMHRGQLDSARVSFAEALVTAKDLVSRDPEQTDWLLQLGATYFWLGSVAYYEDDTDTAAKHFREYFRISQDLVDRDGSNPLWQMELAYAQTNLAMVYRQQHKFSQAMVVLEQAVETKTWLVEQDPSDLGQRESLANSQAIYAGLMEDTGNLNEARLLFSAAREHMEAVAQADSLNLDYQERLATIWHREGRVLRSLGRNAEAEDVFERDLRVAHTLVATDPENRDWQVSLARSLNTLVDHLIAKNDLTNASRHSREAQSVTAQFAAAHPAKLMEQVNRVSLAQAHGEYANSLGLIEVVLAELARSDPSHLDFPVLYLNLLLLRGIAQQSQNSGGEIAPAWLQGATFYSRQDADVVGQFFQDLGVRVLYYGGDRESAMVLAQDLVATGYARQGFETFCKENDLATLSREN